MGCEGFAEYHRVVGHLDSYAEGHDVRQIDLLQTRVDTHSCTPQTARVETADDNKAPVQYWDGVQ